LTREREGRPEQAIVDFGFDSWGRKYGPWDQDDAVPARLAELLRLPRFQAGVVLEAGSIDGNGRGTILTTESCLLNPNRGAGRTRERMEALLAGFLGATNVLWLGEGIEGDDTDGHVDDLARFVDAGTVVTVVEDNAQDPNHRPLRENLARLRAMRDQDGKPLALATLPMPPPLFVAGQRCPASYANFYLANDVALVPTFDAPSDARALAVLRELLPGRQVVGIPSADLVYGLGAIHCMTQQQPL
jgi:agmatine deiminase